MLRGLALATSRRALSTAATPVVALAGASSPVGKAALALIASGEMLGKDTKVSLMLLGADAETVKAVEGSACVASVSSASSASAALKDASYAVLLSGDFKAMGEALSSAKPDCLVGVMGNTNALVTSAASKLPKSSFSAITRHTQMLAEESVAAKTGVAVSEVTNVIAWGSGIADASHAMAGAKWALSAGAEPLPAVGEAGAELVGKAVVSHMSDWALGTGSKWVSMGVPAKFDYGTGEGIFFSVPVVCAPGEYKRVGGVHMTDAVAEKLEADRVALVSEAKAAGI